MIGSQVQTSRAALALSILVMLLLVAGCGGGEQKAQQPPPSPDKAPKDGAKNTPEGKDKGKAPGGNKAGGSTVESKTQVEALKDSPFVLKQRQPVPPDFGAAYQHKALIVFEFFKEGGPVLPSGA